MAGAILISIRSAAAPLAAFVAVLALLLCRMELRPADDGVFASLGIAQTLADGGPYGQALLIPQPGDPVLTPPPLYPLALVPVVLMASDPVRAAAQLDAVLYAGFAALLVIYVQAELGLPCALALALVAGISPAFANPGAFRAPAQALALLLVLAALLAARRPGPPGRAGVGVALAVGGLIGMAALTQLSAALLAPAVLLSALLRRRPAWPAGLAALVAAALFAAVALACGGGGLTEALDRAASDADLRHYAHAVLHGLPLLPGRLSVFWSIDGGPAWAQALLLPLGALGLALRVRRRATAAELLFVMQVGVLLGQADAPGAALDGMLPSMLMLVYAAVGGCAVGSRLWGGAGRLAGGGAVVALSAGLAVAAVPRPPGPDAPASDIMSTGVQAGLHRIRMTIPPNAVLIGPDPLALAFFTGRAAAALRLEPSDPLFWRWVAAVRATHLALPSNPDAPAPAPIPGLDPILDAGTYRLYRLLGPPPDPLRR